MKKQETEVVKMLPIKTVVRFGDPNDRVFEGKIVSARISEYTIMYEIKYWRDGNLVTTMLLPEDFEVKSKKIKGQIVGFVNVEEKKKDEEKA